jgi:hypothetical protein
VATALSRPVATAIGLLAAARRARAFHPVGTARRATVTIDDGVHPLARLAGRHDAVVRTSRGAGLPAVLPDVHGVAVRLLASGATSAGSLERSVCDLLLSSAGTGRLLRHVLRPGWDPARPTYSSLAPYADAAGGRFVVGARFTGDDADDELRLLVARPSERWETVGEIVLGPELDEATAEALRFDPFTCPAGVEPVGWLNDLRRPAYRASQARRAP